MPWKSEGAGEDWLSPFEVNNAREPESFKSLESLESPWAQSLTETDECESALDDRWEPSAEEEEDFESDYSSGELAPVDESEDQAVYLAEEEDAETEECCGGHEGEGPKTDAQSALEVDSEDIAVDEEKLEELESQFENEETFDEAEDIAWEMDWHEEEAPSARVLPAGSTIIEKVPLLRNHAGIGPDLILAWNEISGAPTSVDVVVHLHGYALSSGNRLHIARDVKSRSGLDWSDPGGGSTSPGRTRPTLAVLPRGHYYGGKSKRAYSFPALTLADGIQKLVDLALQHLATALGVPSLSHGRLILTAHSGGVASILRILLHVDPHEVHVFDGLYQDAGPLIQWATRRAGRDQGLIAMGTRTLRSYMAEQGGALRVLYGAGTARFSRPVARAMDKLLARDSALRRWYRSERTTVGHLKVPPVYGWRLLADASADVPNAAVEKGAVGQELAEEFTIEGETVTVTGAVVTFPSGVTLPIITGPATATDTDDYFDPVGSGNPLLDTSASKKNLKLSTSFTVRELTTSGGKSGDIARIDPKLVECLQRLRDHVGKPLTITSGFRSWKRNRDVYKARNKPPTRSQHCAGRAADIKIGGMNGLQIAKAAIDAYGPNIGIGVGGTFAHIDVRGVAKAWNYGGATKTWVAQVQQYQRQKGGGVSIPARAPAPSTRLARPPQGGQIDWCQMRRTVAATARAEEARWTAPNGARLVESDASQLPILTEYWAVVPGFAGNAAAVQAQQSANDQPNAEWSAAFICFVMHAAGVRAAHGFEFSQRHLNYIVGALRNRERTQQNRPFWLVDHVELEHEATPEPGDLVCFNRCVRRPNHQDPGCRRDHVWTRHSYESLRRQFWLGGNQNAQVRGSSHCSIVVGTTQQGGQHRLELIGGNEDHSVRVRTHVPIDADGHIVNALAHHIFGMVKLTGC